MAGGACLGHERLRHVGACLRAATEDFFDINATWETFRYAKRRYTMLGHAEKVDILENNAGHNYNRIQREGAVRWLARWLQGRVATIEAPDLDRFTDEELQVTPEGQVMLLPGERSIYDLNTAYEETLAAEREKRLAEMTPDALRDKVRAIAGIRPLEDLPVPEVKTAEAAKAAGGRVSRLVFVPEPGIALPAVAYWPDRRSAAPVILLHEGGKKAVKKEAEKRMRAGHPVLAVDLRGTGETQQAGQSKFGADLGTDWEDYVKAYVLGLSYAGMRAEDLLVCARWFAKETGADRIAVRATGNIGVPALHAAALEPDLIGPLHIEKTLASWRYAVRQRPTRNQLINTVHGVLRVYDLPDLAALRKDAVTITKPVDARGQYIADKP
jgi:pimeloyl-ACP methyl ester carboxylesterase